jgi:AcrR family transcriptional regulator
VSTESAREDRVQTPLAAVTEALERAVALSELTPEQLQWSIARLSHRAERAVAAGTDGRRREITSAGARVFLRRGYLNATVEEVAHEVSLTKAAIYHYFRSKEALMDAIVEASLAAAEAAISDALGGPGDAAQRLRRALERCVDCVLDDEGTRVLLRNLDEVSDAVSPEASRRCRRIRALLVGQLEEGQAEGLFERVDPAVTVLSLIGAVTWLTTWYDPEGPLARSQVRDILVAQLLAAVLPRGAAP